MAPLAMMPFMLLLSLPLLALCSSPPPLTLSLGYHKSLLPSPIFYSSYVPLIFEYRVPSYKPVDITLRDWRGKCESDNYAPSYTCPVFFHFERYLERFENDVVPPTGLNPITNSSFMASPLHGGLGASFCSKIQPHFTSTFTQEAALEIYLNQLRDCPPGELRLNREIQDYIYGIKTLFKKMNENFENEFSNKFFTEANKKLGPAFYVNAVTTHQNGMIGAYTMEKLRWASAQGKCAQGMIPEMVVRPENITSAVGDLNAKLGIGELEPSVPLQEVNRFYKMKIADCTFVKRTGHFIVRVLLPVKRRNVNPKLYKVTSIPFIRFWNLCRLSPIPGSFIYEPRSKELQTLTSCDSSPGSLCQYMEGQGSLDDLCTRSIFRNHTIGIKTHCRMSCTPVSTLKDLVDFPLIQQLGGDSWTITGANDGEEKPTIKCQGSTFLQEIDARDTTILIKIPCHCSIMYRSEEFIPASQDCIRDSSKEPELNTILPPHFIKDEILPSFTQGKIIEPENLEPENISKDMSTSTTFVPSSLNPAEKLKGDSSTTSVPSTPMVDNAEKLEGSSPSLGLLWTLVIFQLILILVILGLATYRYIKYQKEMRYSKERLVYNIYNSPSEPNLQEVRGGTDGIINRL